jgi:hypothetical protein
MSHSYVSNLMHCTFSTKNRYPFIDADTESRLWPYLGGIHRKKTFEEEFLALPEKHGIEYDSRHLFRNLSRPLHGLDFHFGP